MLQLSFFILITLGKFNALDNRRMNGQSHCCKITRKRILMQYEQTARGRSDGRTDMIFYLSHDNVLEKKCRQNTATEFFKLIPLCVNVQR